MKPDNTEIQPVSRALRVLEVLNKRASTSLKTLHAETLLPKSSLVRILEALAAAGYVEKTSRRAGYRLTARVLRLSSGFGERDRVVDVAEPLMREFTARLRWPVTLATFNGEAMRLRFTTAKDSPLSPDRAGGTATFPIFESALGRAYVAYCPRTERKLILDTLAGSDLPAHRAAREPAMMERVYASIRKQGYAATGPIPGDRGLGLALPIIVKRQVLATVTMRLYRSSMSEAEAVRRYLPELQKLTSAIVTALARAQPALLADD